MEATEDTWALLTSPCKLDRDKGVSAMEELLKNGFEGAKTNDVGQMEVDDAPASDTTKPSALFSTKLMSMSSTCSQSPWEVKLGFLLAGKTLLAHAAETPSFAEEKDAECLKKTLTGLAILLLSDEEVRVRGAAGEILGELCLVFGTDVYEEASVTVLDLIRSNMEREQQQQSAAEEAHEDYYAAGKTAEAIFHDTAGWRNLETSMKCLQHMVEGCGPRFHPFVTSPLLDLILTSASHKNRFIRETGLFLLTSFLSTGILNEDASLSCPHLKEQVAQHVGLGLTDNWSQVRLAASVACRTLLTGLDSDARRDEFFPALLPKLCLNRYYMAEGVKLYSQETWRLACGQRGRGLVERHLDRFVDYYVECTRAENHAVREAGCHCIAELAAKIRPEALSPHVERLLQTLLECFEDDSWPVRDTACVASGNFVLAFPEESKGKFPTLLPLFVEQLKDSISSVRQGAAIAICNAVRAYKTEVLPDIVDLLKQGLEGIKAQPVESARYGDFASGAAAFGVAKRLRDNDPAIHENQQMYSCGSLAPKMGRGSGGCKSYKFRKASEPWEFADGCIHLYAELTEIGDFNGNLHSILPKIAAACGQRHYTLHLSFLETVMNRLPTIAENLGKKFFKPYLDEFLESMFYAFESENGLASYAAELCISFMSHYLGPNIFRGRVENIGPRYLDVLEKVMVQSGADRGVGGPGVRRSDAVSVPRSHNEEPMPHLGGTPT